MCKKLTSVLLALVLLVGLAGCGNSEQDKKFDDLTAKRSAVSSGPESKDEPAQEEAQTLTVLTTYENDYAGLKPWVKDFNRLHPGKELKIEYGVDSISSNEQMDAYRTRWTTELMSGEACDILLDEGYINPAQYEQSHLMYDIYEWMDNDPDFQDADYFHNLFEAFEVNGHLYTLPVTYNFEFVYLNSALLQASGVELSPWDKVDYKTILEIYRRAEEQGLLADNFTLQYLDMTPKSRLFLDTEMVNYVSLENRSADFDSQAFVDYLTETKSIPCRRKISDGLAMVSGRATFMMEEFAKSNAEGNTSLMMDFMVSLDGWADNMDVLVDGCAGPFVLASAQGSQSFYPEVKVCVPTSCKNPERAWEFLKFMIAPAEIPAYGQRWIPEGSVDLSKTFATTNRENFRTFAKLYSKGSNYVLQTGGAAWDTGFDPNDAECPLTDEVLDKLETVIEGITQTKDRFGPLEDLMLPTLQEYYETDTVTAEQCAQRLQEIAWVYLNE